MSNLDLEGLDDFSSFIDGSNKPIKESGKPLEIPLENVAEDPNQPRQTFDDDAMAELTDSVIARGIKTPISVRPDSENEGKYIINHGARRYRAAKAAGLTALPAYVDDDYLYSDQLVENIQREALTVQETIAGVGKLLSQGMKKSDIAKQTGKTKAWVSYYSKAQNLPSSIQGLLDAKLCQDIIALIALVDCHGIDDTQTDSVTNDWIQQETSVSRKMANNLKKELKEGPLDNADQETITYQEADETLGAPSEDETLDGVSAAGDYDVSMDSDNETLDDSEPSVSEDSDTFKESSEPKTKKPQVEVKVDGREAVILLKKPATYGLAWVEYEDGSADEVAVGDINLVAVTDAG